MFNSSNTAIVVGSQALAIRIASDPAGMIGSVAETLEYASIKSKGIEGLPKLTYVSTS